MHQPVLFVHRDVLAVRSAELRVLERVNIALSLAFVSPLLVVSTSTMLTLIAYTSAGNDLSPEQVIDFLGAPPIYWQHSKHHGLYNCTGESYST